MLCLYAFSDLHLCISKEGKNIFSFNFARIRRVPGKQFGFSLLCNYFQIEILKSQSNTFLSMGKS